MPLDLVADTIAYLERATAAAKARAEAARANRVTYSEKVREAILQAAEPIPPARRTISLVRRRLEMKPGFYGLETAPDRRTVSKYLHKHYPNAHTGLTSCTIFASSAST